jgi:ubiquinone biosynthesis protein UbiJ
MARRIAMPRRGAADVVAAVEAAAEDLFMAGKSWGRYLTSRQAEPDDPLLAEAEAIAAEITRLRRSVSALADRLQEVSSA